MAGERPPRGPVSLPDVVRVLNDHTEEDRQNFDAMKAAFAKVDEQNRTFDTKQDEQIDYLQKLLKHSDYQSQQATESGIERGRRQEMEKQAREAKKKAEKREERLKWAWRFVIVPLVVVLTHLLTKWWERGREPEPRRETVQPVPAQTSAPAVPAPHVP